MKRNFVDCLMLMSTALSSKLPEMGRPLIQESPRTIVDVSLSVRNLRILDAHEMLLQTTALLNQRWFDPRLGANENTRKKAVSGQIWSPKLTNINGLSVTNAEQNKDTIFWRGFGTEGRVLLSERVVLNSHCTTDLRSFPFDSQRCQIKFGSYRFPMEEVELRWDSKGLEILSSSALNGFTLTNVTTSLEIDVRASGNFSILNCQFTIRRHGFHFVFCTILPAVFSVLLSYLPFWIDLKEQHVSRFSINIFSCGSLLYAYYETACSMPPVDHLKALDVFVLMSCAFALSSLGWTFLVDLLRSWTVKYVGFGKSSFKKEYKLVVWIERSFRLAFPVLYVFCVLVFCFYYVSGY